MRHRQTRVFLALAWHELGHMLGINRYASEHNWILEQSHFSKHMEAVRQFSPQGIISQLAKYMPDLVEAVETAHVPTVELCDSLPAMKVPRVMPDEEAEGVLAAAHLIERGFTQFVFIGYLHDARCRRAFTQAIHAANGTCRVVNIDDAEMVLETGQFLTSSELLHDKKSNQRRKWARRFFSDCDKPVGVYVRSAVWAFDIIEGCRAARIAVPEQVAVVGLADTPGAGAAWRVPLAVVTPDYEEQGYQAARLLDRMMKGEPVPPDTIIRVPPKDLVPRMSTMCHATTNLHLARAATYIIRNLHDPGLCVKQVKRAAKASHTTFYREFFRQFNMPIAHYIEHLRLKEARHLLETTDATASAIAARCGFGDLRHFRHALVRATGTGPAGYRLRGSSAPVLCAARSVVPPGGVV